MRQPLFCWLKYLPLLLAGVLYVLQALMLKYAHRSDVIANSIRLRVNLFTYKINGFNAEAASSPGAVPCNQRCRSASWCLF